MIMDKLEKVEKLRAKTGVSYEDAKNALEACDYDLLDAIIYLEKLDKVKAPEVESFTTGEEQKTSTEFEQAQQTYTNDCNKVTFGQMMDRFFKWCGRILKKSVDSTFIVERRGQTMINVPVLVLVPSLLTVGLISRISITSSRRFLIFSIFSKLFILSSYTL